MPKPLPKPRTDEDHDAWVARCMANPTMRREYPEPPQRQAVCERQWDEKGVRTMAATMKTPADHYGQTEGPLGLTMRDDVAKYVAGILKDLPADCKELIDVAGGPVRRMRTATIVDQGDLEPRTEVSFVTLDTVDRDKEVMLPKGMDWAQFQKNPVVTWQHQYDQFPVGRAKWVKKAEKNDHQGYLAKTEYIAAPDEWKGDWWVDAVWHYVRSGYLPGKSVGFIPLELGKPKEADLRAHPEWAEVSYIIAKSLMLEYAVATVQSNPDAILEAASEKGLAVPLVVQKSLDIVVPDPLQPAAPAAAVSDGEPAAETKALVHNHEVSEDAPDWGDVDKTKLPRNAHAGEGEAGEKSTWRLPHHWVKGGEVGDDGTYSDGTMYLHRAGLSNAWAVAGKEDSEAPTGAKEHLAKHREALGLEGEPKARATGTVVAEAGSPEALHYKTPEEIHEEIITAADAGADVWTSEEIEKIAQEAVDRLRGRI